MQRFENDFLIELVNRALGIQVNATSPMASVTTNQVFKVESTSGTYVLKHFLNDEHLPVDRARQFGLQRIGHSLQLAPEPLWLDEQQGWMIESYVTPWKTRPSIEKLATTVAQFHKHAVSGYELDIIEKWNAYCAILSNENPLKKQLPTFADSWRLLQSEHAHEHVLCHNDLQFAHLTSNENVCLDWEYAGQHCRFFDIACSFVINNLTHQEQSAFLAEYAEVTGFSQAYIEGIVHKTLPFVIFTFDLWNSVVDAAKTTRNS